MGLADRAECITEKSSHLARSLLSLSRCELRALDPARIVQPDEDPQRSLRELAAILVAPIRVHSLELEALQFTQPFEPWTQRRDLLAQGFRERGAHSAVVWLSRRDFCEQGPDGRF